MHPSTTSIVLALMALTSSTLAAPAAAPINKAINVPAITFAAPNSLLQPRQGMCDVGYCQTLLNMCWQGTCASLTNGAW